MARKKREFDEKEVEEIIQLQLQNVNGILKKLSYNGVYTLNKKIAQNKDYLRKNGEMFSMYAYDFWGGSYAGEDNFGKKKIDELKSKRVKDLDNEIFDTSIQDVLLAVNDLHKNPVKLSNVLVKIYSKDREKIDRLENENKEYRDILLAQKEKIDLLEKTIYNLFYNSKSTRNSLKNVLELKKSDDWFVQQQLENAFCSNKELLDVLKNGEETEKNNTEIIDIKMVKKLKRLEELGFE